MVLLQPLHPLPTPAVELRREHRLRGEIGVGARRRSCESGPDAAVDGVIPVGGGEGGQGPVGLDEAVLRGPIFGVP